MKQSLDTLTSLAAVAVLVLAAIACGDDDAGATGTTSATGEPVGPGVVSAKPADATQVDVVLREWAIAPQTTSVRAGKVYFLADNQGPEDPHELVIIRSDLAPDALPLNQGKVPEDRVEMIDEIEPFAPRSKASLTVDLRPGRYVLICNIAELEAGEVESHYQLGMRAAFTVE